MTMYAVTYSTESGDEGFVGLFKELPTEGHLAAIARRDYPWEVVDDDGDVFSCIHFEVAWVEDFSELPDPIEPIEGI